MVHSIQMMQLAQRTIYDENFAGFIADADGLAPD
ncbi:hypothetical protein MP213Fo_19770 [Pseudochrobactrum sp. MP213Fo]